MSTAVPTHSKVWLKRGREKSLLRKHPWLFSGAIERVQGEPGPGETVEIVDAIPRSEATKVNRGLLIAARGG